MKRDKKEQMPGRLMERAFFEDAPERVARRLLGKLLVRRTSGGLLAGRIVEVEAYLGPHRQPPDPAAHAHRGLTPRNQVLFGPAGHAYVYSIYGQYYCMNISCEKAGRAGCVLLRALEPLEGLEQMAWNRGIRGLPSFSSAKANDKDGATEERMDGGAASQTHRFPPFSQRTRKGWGNARALTRGPGRLCQALGITRHRHNGLDLLDPESPLQVREDGMRVERVLVTRRIGIRRAAELPLRFAIPGHGCVSGPRKIKATTIALRAGSTGTLNP